MPRQVLDRPLHRHNREDEYSYVLEERMGRYELDMQPESVPGLLERFDLRMGEPT